MSEVGIRALKQNVSVVVAEAAFYVDASALVKLVVAERKTGALRFWMDAGPATLQLRKVVVLSP